MGKRIPSFDDSQLRLSLGQHASLIGDGALAGIERKIASAVALALKDDPRTRLELAADVSAILDDTVTKAMLDAYASERRSGHNISMGRALALFAATRRLDILNALLGDIGVRIITADELLTLELGHTRLKLSRMSRRAAFLEKIAPEIGDLS